MDVEIFQELLFTVGLSVMVLFILVKLNSHEADNKTFKSSVHKKHGKKPLLRERGFGRTVANAKDSSKAAHREAIEFSEKLVLEGDIWCVGDMKEEVDGERTEMRMDAENELDESNSKSEICSTAIDGQSEVWQGEFLDELPNYICSEDEEEEWSLDDWEGIERTELEKVFGSAVVFACSESNADRLDSDMKTKLYALHRVATEGPCSEPQPIALKVSARAKWNAWQKLGNMSQEAAMEKYIALISENIADWKEDDEVNLQDVGTVQNLASSLEDKHYC